MQPLVVRLVVEFRAAEGRVFRSIAQLHLPAESDLGDVCAPLFDPVLELQNSRGQILACYQLEAAEGGTAKYWQAWLVKQR